MSRKARLTRAAGSMAWRPRKEIRARRPMSMQQTTSSTRERPSVRRSARLAMRGTGICLVGIPLRYGSLHKGHVLPAPWLAFERRCSKAHTDPRDAACRKMGKQLHFSLLRVRPAECPHPVHGGDKHGGT
jgi:hypothetical protein